MWQSCSTANANAYSVALSTRLTLLGKTVAQTLSTQSGTMNYTYSSSPIDDFICPEARGVRPTGTTSGTSPTPTRTPRQTLSREQSDWLESSIRVLLPGGSVLESSIATNLNSTRAKREMASDQNNPYYTFLSHYTIRAPAFGSDDIHNIPHPAPWTEDFLQRMEKMGFSRETYLKRHAMEMMEVDRINNDPNFESPASKFNYEASLKRFNMIN